MKFRALVASAIAGALVLAGLVGVPATALTSPPPPAPMGLTANVAANGTVHFAWAASPGAGGYKVEWSTSSNFPTGTATSFADTYATDYITTWEPAAQTGGTLYWRVSAYGTAKSSTTRGEAAVGNPIAVGLGIAPEPIGPGSADERAPELTSFPAPTVFSWQPVAGAVAYQLEYTSGEFGDAATTTKVVAGTQFTPTSPLARTNGGAALTWKWRVSAAFYDDPSTTTAPAYGEPSDTRYFSIVWTEAPDELYPADNTSRAHSDLLFSWSKVDGAAKYRITFGDSNAEGNWTPEQTKSVDVATTTYVPTVQVTDKTRYWQVTPLDSAGHPGTPSPVQQYRKMWGSQHDEYVDSSTAAGPVGITGAAINDPATNPEMFLSDFQISWEPLPRATFYMVEVRDDFTNVYTCRTASTSVTIIASYIEGNANAGALDGVSSCLWNADQNKRIQQNRTYHWTVRAVDLTGSSTMDFQSGALPAGARFSAYSPTRHFDLKSEVGRAAPSQNEVDLDLGAFATDNKRPGDQVQPAPLTSQPAPLMKWERSGMDSAGERWPVPAYEIILFSNRERTAEIGRIRTPSTRAVLNGVFDDNNTANPYFASILPISPQTASWTGSALYFGESSLGSPELFEWSKSSTPLTIRANQPTSDGSLLLSWAPQSTTGVFDGGSRGYQVSVYLEGQSTPLGTRKVEYPFFVAQKPVAAANESAFPSTVLDAPLPSGTNYYYKVAPLDANGNPGAAARSELFSAGIATPAVEFPAVVSGGAAVLSWAPVPGAAKYAVQYRGGAVSNWTTVTTANPTWAQTSAALHGLASGDYEWQVRALDSATPTANTGAWSDIQRFTVGTVPASLDTPDGAVLSLDDRILRWTPNSDGEALYKVQIAEDVSFNTIKWQYTTVGSAVAIPDELAATKQYFWRVQDLAEPVGSAAPQFLSESAKRSFTVRGIPSKIGLPTLAVDGTGIKASWTLLAGSATGTDQPISYVVQWRAKAADADWSLAQEHTTEGPATNVSVPVVPGVVYEFRVAGKNTEGVGPWSDIKELASATAPTGAPTVSVKSQVGSLLLTLTKPTATGGTPITGYRIEYGPVDGALTSVSTATAVSTYAIPGLDEATDYVVSVYAVNSVGEGPASTKVATTLGLASVPTTVKASRGDKSATITWAEPSTPNGPIAGYTVQYRLSTSTAWTTAANVSGTTLKYTKTSLLNGKTYQFRVAAKTSVGSGDFSTPVSVVPAGKPILSSTLKAVSSSTGTVTVSWGRGNSNGSAITSYTVKYSTNGTTWYTLKTVSPSTLKVTSTKGSHGKKVYFRLYAKNGVGTSAYKSISVIRK